LRRKTKMDRIFEEVMQAIHDGYDPPVVYDARLAAISLGISTKTLANRQQAEQHEATNTDC
jgi:heterodisulfide reductase subunit B